MVGDEGTTSSDSEGDSSPTEVDLGSLELDAAPFTEGRPKPADRTRALLAYLLLGLLAGIIATLLTLLAFRRITSEEFGTIAGVLIAPVVGLLGAATGYYYGKGGR